MTKKKETPHKPTNNAEITERKRQEGKDLGGRPRFEVDYKMLEALCGTFHTGEECAAIMKVTYKTLNTALQRDYKEAWEALNEGRTEEDGFLEPDDRFNGFDHCFRIYSAQGKSSLRREQYKMATAKEDSPNKRIMLVHLGNNYLGQSKRIDHTTKGEKLPAGGNTFIEELDLSPLDEDEFMELGRLLGKAKVAKMHPDEGQNSDDSKLH